MGDISQFPWKPGVHLAASTPADGMSTCRYGAEDDTCAFYWLRSQSRVLLQGCSSYQDTSLAFMYLQTQRQSAVFSWAQYCWSCRECLRFRFHIVDSSASHDLSVAFDLVPFLWSLKKVSCILCAQARFSVKSVLNTSMVTFCTT